MFRLKKKVKILSSRKINGEFNFGSVVGIELMSDAFCLTYRTPTEFIARYKVPRYKVAYIDCCTKRAECDWFRENELEAKTK